MRKARWAAALILVAVAAGSSCSSEEPAANDTTSSTPADPTTSTPSPTVEARPVGDRTGHGPLLSAGQLTASVYDGHHVWLAGEDGTLLAFDPDTSKVMRSSRAQPAVGAGGLVTVDGKLHGIGQDGDGDAYALTIDTDDGTRHSERLPGRPFGQVLADGDRLLAVDFDLGLVEVDPDAGTTRTVADPPTITNLAQPAGPETYWFVDDTRSHVLLFDPSGTKLDIDGFQDIRSLAVDDHGTAWITTGTTVHTIDADGQQHAQPGFANVTRLARCGTSIVASDIEEGTVTWFDEATPAVTSELGEPGVAVACDTDTVWYLTADGYLTTVTRP